MRALADLLHRIFVKCFSPLAILHTAGLVLQSTVYSCTREKRSSNLDGLSDKEIGVYLVV